MLLEESNHNHNAYNSIQNVNYIISLNKNNQIKYIQAQKYIT